MKDKMSVISMMDRYDMRKNIGPYTFGFVEGKYQFCYHNHSTGRHLIISIIAPDGDKMEVYDKKEWYYSRYYFNGFGNGYVSGPWIDEIELLFKKFRSEIAVRIQAERQKKKTIKKANTEAEQVRMDKFAKLCSTMS